MADGMINLTIDGAPVSVPAGTLVIEAAKQAGVLVPHYCYHPGLPVAGLCRMCLVEIEKAPKLQIACATTVTEGMVVKTQTAPAKDARQGVLEFLLINHPLDCPICDQAGECELRSEEHTSELQSQSNLVCRLLLEKKKIKKKKEESHH